MLLIHLLTQKIITLLYFAFEKVLKKMNIILFTFSSDFFFYIKINVRKVDK